MFKFISKFPTICLLALFTMNASAIIPAAPDLAAKSYLLMDFDSGKIIVEHNADMPVPPASLTKMMTSYVVSAEIASGNLNLTDKVTISKNAWAQNPAFAGSSLTWIEVNTEVTVDDLLKGVIIQSGNDASVALAEHIAGSEDVFADLMNQHAEKLGMVNTNFENSNGLPAEGHLSTARDLALLTAAMIRDYPEEYAYYKEKWFTFNGIKQANRNKLLWDESLDVDGVKTGHTEAAGFCLVSSATKNNMRLISVVMGTNSKEVRKVESKKLLSYGFRFYETIKPLEAGKQLHQQQIWMGEKDLVNLGIASDIYLTIPRGQAKNLKARYVVEKDIEAPIAKGQLVGKVFFTLAEESYAEYPLVALEGVEEAGFFGRMSDSVSRWFGSIF
ncbi:MAG: D-alanyl-D-alanine carboxypeptidase family protein [Kangiellaceae bacterium]|jgi:serine-type D-Ala-D-Ala carboxypeptidase (penicillin-binding protein 5/6)